MRPTKSAIETSYSSSKKSPHKNFRRLLQVGLFTLALSGAIVSCGGSSNDPGLTDSAALQAAVPAAFMDATFAGKTANTNMFAAVVTHASGVEAYFCDGTRDFWFRGLASNSSIEMTDASGAKLVLDVARDVVAGELTVAGVTTSFELPKAEPDSLFRADTLVGSQRVLAGWIRLPNGEQRGVIRNDAISLPSTLNIDTAQARITPICTGCESFQSALAIAPFTPEAAQRRPNVPQEFTVIGLGDSFMSGEGAPVVYGTNLTGLPPNIDFLQTVKETWASGLPSSRGQRNFNISDANRQRLAREALACHRGAAGLGLAVDALRQTWPANIDLIHQTFACSGAEVKHLVNTTYSGPGGCGKLAAEITELERNQAVELNKRPPNLIAATLIGGSITRKNIDYAACKTITDDTDTNSISAQLPEAIRFLSAQRLKADAVVMSIGGNDLGFGNIIANCISPGTDCSSAGSPANTALIEGKENLPAAYLSLNAALSTSGITSPSIYLTSHPNPLSKNASRTCAGSDFFPDLLLQNLSDNNARFGVGVLFEINRQVKDSVSKGYWKPIISRIDSATGRGMCSDDPWYNSRNAALVQQGHDLLSPEKEGVPLLNIILSAGMFHPNQKGQLEGYMPGYRDVLNEALIQRFTPKPPARFRPVAFRKDAAGRTSVEVVWDDMNEHESNSLISNAVGATSEFVTRDSTRGRIDLDSSNTGQLSIKACFDRPGTSALCSTNSAPITVDAKVPTHTPARPGSQLRNRVVAIGTAQDLRRDLSWSDSAPSRLWTTVELATDSGVTRQAVLGQAISVPAQGVNGYRLAACNTLGCGPATAWLGFSEPLPAPTINSSNASQCQAGEVRVGSLCKRDNIRP